MMLPESPRALAVDGTAAAWAALIFFKVIPAITALAAVVLVILRIVIAVQEYTLNRRRLEEGE
jgi:hypothetical protein